MGLHGVLLALAGIVAIASSGGGRSEDGWSTVSARTDPQATVLSQGELVRWGASRDSQFAPVATGDAGELSVRADVLGIAQEFRFTLDNQLPGVKQRLELTNCFVTNDTLMAAGVDPAGLIADDLRDLRMLYDHCAGAPTVDAARGWSSTVEMQVSYDLLIPKDGLPEGAQSIIGQFHGREDPRVFLAPNGSTGSGVDRQRTFAKGSVVHYPTDLAARICRNSSRRYGNCFNGQLLGPDGAPSGWLYQSGGFPPLVFGYDPVSKWFYVEGRSDDREFKMTHTKADCHFHWPIDFPNKRHCADAPHETVQGLWRQPRSEFPFDEWLRFEWFVRWSSYSNADTGVSVCVCVCVCVLRFVVSHLFAPTIHKSSWRTGSHRNGSVSLTIAGNKTVDWRGPIGRNDGGRLPYFKIGVYNPSGVRGRTQVCVHVCVCVCVQLLSLVPGRIQVFFRNYSQSWKSDDTAVHTRDRPRLTETRKNVVPTPRNMNVNFTNYHLVSFSGSVRNPVRPMLNILGGYMYYAEQVLMVMDDARPDLNYAYGQAFMKTPNMDRLAKSGMVFRHAYSQFAVCSPSRCVCVRARVCSPSPTHVLIHH